ncbi:hypothetical protein OsI_29528 [Oryza sativa Indica Group]|uniref:Uncharacterized protein n=1 Tax=Oryza sativa subsp. indica TaxID=39946 RepID=B8BBJ4_ORYSI|nr:hypothetical protein OsI_29528 [Oryza sativa Indica Group]
MVWWSCFGCSLSIAAGGKVRLPAPLPDWPQHSARHHWGWVPRGGPCRHNGNISPGSVYFEDYLIGSTYQSRLLSVSHHMIPPITDRKLHNSWAASVKRCHVSWLRRTEDGANQLISVRQQLRYVFERARPAAPFAKAVGDFGILVRSGFTVTKALFFNFLSALVALAGTALALSLGKDPGHSSLIEGFTAGGFIYIAVAGVLPEMNDQKTTVKSSMIQLVSLTMGMLVALGISLVE